MNESAGPTEGPKTWRGPVQSVVIEDFASKAKLLQLKLIHIFARAMKLGKDLEIEKTKPTFIISVLKVE